MPANPLPTRPYKGTRDFYPEDMALRNWFFEKMRRVVESYGYQEYGGPILENFDLYAAKSGEELVNEQIYHFKDQGGRHLAIRPEMTPTVARMVAARLGELVFPLRWFTIVNLMRYERPQRGRLREHWQLNVDLFGESGMHADLEILRVIVDLMGAFGADATMFQVRLSNRRLFNDVLARLLEADAEQIHVISKAVDKRAKIKPEAYEAWLAESGIDAEKARRLDEIFAMSLDQLCEAVGDDSHGAREMRQLHELIRAAGLEDYCAFDFSIVRGFDYYTGTVMEVVDLSPENRRALFGGGRYDDLIGLFKKSDVSGIGFGFGDVTFQDFLETHNLIPEDLRPTSCVMIVPFEDTPFGECVALSDELRAAGIANNIYPDPSAKLKKQLSFAERKGYAVVALLGAQELEDGKVVVRHLARSEQDTVAREDCPARIAEWLGGGSGA